MESDSKNEEERVYFFDDKYILVDEHVYFFDDKYELTCIEIPEYLPKNINHEKCSRIDKIELDIQQLNIMLKNIIKVLGDQSENAHW